MENMRHSTWIGVGWMVLTGLCFVAVTGIVRYVGSDVPAAQAAFIRYLAGFVVLLPWLVPMVRSGIGAAEWGYFGLRGIAHALGVILWFYAMARIPIAEVTAIGYTSPIYITIGAALFLGETLAFRRIMAVVVAFIGALIILRPGLQDISIGQQAQVLAALVFAVSYLLAKRFSGRYDAGFVVGQLTIFVTIGLAPFAFAVWQPVSLADTLWLCLVAVFATFGHWTMTKALAAAPVMVTQPVTFLQIVWAALLGWIAFGEPLDPYVLLGGAVIIAAVTFISYREWVVARREKT